MQRCDTFPCFADLSFGFGDGGKRPTEAEVARLLLDDLSIARQHVDHELA